MKKEFVALLAAFSLAMTGVTMAQAQSANQSTSIKPPITNNPFFRFRDSLAVIREISARVVTINDYGDHLQAGVATDQEQARCVQSLQDLKDFVAYAKAEQGTHSDTRWGDKTLADGIERRLRDMDVNSCPTLPDYQKNGNASFTRPSPLTSQ